MKFLIVIEPTQSGYSAYSPDLDGCIATGPTRSDVLKNIREAIEFHLDGLKQEGYELPVPQSDSAIVEVAV